MPEPFIVDGVWIPKAIVGIRSCYAVPLYLELRRHCYETSECFPGVRRLAQLVGCAVGTVSALTDQFHALGIVTKLHDGRRCLPIRAGVLAAAQTKEIRASFSRSNGR